ncbi:MAG: RluA family pseudouridine synthase [Candidatus Krumholzibacteria bacterium]|nr:RluA family pseudouridine synthase [Candidatus Krumholzibacteria bacterium]
MSDNKIFRFIVDEEESGERIDSFLSGRIPELSRSRIQKAVKAGEVLCCGKPVGKVSSRVAGDDTIELKFTPPVPLSILPEDIPLDIVYEDSSLLVVNKQAGMVAHPAPGNETGTLVNALLHHCSDLSGIGGVIRPGIVHRLDRLTSGLLVVAKDDITHISLSRQLQERKVKRIYFAFVWGGMPAEEGEIDLPIGRSSSDRKKMAVIHRGGRQANTNYYVLDTFGPLQYIKIKLGTGRTHQIRVHLAHVGHPVIGDPVYGGNKIRKGSLGKFDLDKSRQVLSMIERQALHAGELSFFHPKKEELMSFEAPLPPDMESMLSFCRRSW